MKKLTAFVLAFALLAGVLSGCGTDQDSSEHETQAVTTTTTAQNITSDISTFEETDTTLDMEESTSDINISNDNIEDMSEEFEEGHWEYEATAIQGAMITDYDTETGDLKYQFKCEYCGECGQNARANVKGMNTDQNFGFTCTNPSCSEWGKSQQAIIHVDGKWIE